MYGVRHHITAEFPEFKHKIEELKSKNQNFARLLERYTATDKEIYHQLERQPLSTSYLESLKKWRLTLKDQIYNMLRSEQARTHITT